MHVGTGYLETGMSRPEQGHPNEYPKKYGEEGRRSIGRGEGTEWEKRGKFLLFFCYIFF